MAYDSTSEYDSSTHSSLESLLRVDHYRKGRKERDIACCKVKYQARSVTNKGAVLVLVRNFFVITVYFYFVRIHPVLHEIPISAIWGILLPAIGWLADVCLGRHKMIHWSMCIMWAGFMLATLSSVVAQLV